MIGYVYVMCVVYCLLPSIHPLPNDHVNLVCKSIFVQLINVYCFSSRC